MRRSSDISITSPSVNKTSTTVQKDPKGSFEDMSTEVPVTDLDAVKSLQIWKDKSIPIPQQY